MANYVVSGSKARAELLAGQHPEWSAEPLANSPKAFVGLRFDVIYVDREAMRPDDARQVVLTVEWLARKFPPSRVVFVS